MVANDGQTVKHITSHGNVDKDESVLSCFIAKNVSRKFLVCRSRAIFDFFIFQYWKDCAGRSCMAMSGCFGFSVKINKPEELWKIRSIHPFNLLDAFVG